MRSRVLTADLPRWVDPAAVFSELMAQCASDAAGAVWLDSGAAAHSGRSYLAVSSRAVLSTDLNEPVFEWMRREFTMPEVDHSAAPAGFRLGWIGWLGYELRGESLGVPITTPAATPDAAWLWVDRVIVFDHGSQSLSLLALGESWRGELAQWRERIAALVEAASTRPTAPAAAPLVTFGSDPAPAPTSAPVPIAVWRDSDSEYLEMIAACQRSIVEGDAYQLCLTTSVHVDHVADPVATYLALRQVNPSHHGGFLQVGETALLSSTPEQFLAIDPTGLIETKPIKGTRRRRTDPAEDQRLAAELLASDKERAENLMIVDLMRNDLGRVCEVGSVTVPTLFAVESYATVHQLVSTIRGQLRSDVGAVDAIEASFPAGSMTGAPKHSATLILDTLERAPRGIYAGVFGYVGLDGAVDLAMVIRSIVMDAGGSTIGAGGGITALSVPDEELAEVKLKAAALLRVLGVPAG
ncbi:anthranilate synthase component I family protein [Salinibacterium sp. NSLL150]|uniref:anthranilate synthase component I family protein n=1 Tax=unclassified Salinibacterium TaxID=2632331 RepID=UPI0018CF743E|nr:MULTISPECIES: anthranilate synthase component I family protein [unclassified Salinibacterium]MBH0098896.1 anthranilate synthase component I family protein [Salinibacterium sp. NSLL35]MBH0101651.1 anthranilate synthase component I family protein [Salinibacterium sp. NSLL150]MBH0104410.1 anthranilate synthase component I family protein [Salinibacterium sp. NSLL16]MBH0107171.1 anthranilate synthase component I family protein [Salinibacterium sp. NSLL17]